MACSPPCGGRRPFKTPAVVSGFLGRSRKEIDIRPLMIELFQFRVARWRCPFVQGPRASRCCSRAWRPGDPLEAGVFGTLPAIGTPRDPWSLMRCWVPLLACDEGAGWRLGLWRRFSTIARSAGLRRAAPGDGGRRRPSDAQLVPESPARSRTISHLDWFVDRPACCAPLSKRMKVFVLPAISSGRGRAATSWWIKEVPRGCAAKLGLGLRGGSRRENAAAGFGITAKICGRAARGGPFDCITTGKPCLGTSAEDHPLHRAGQAAAADRSNFPPGTPRPGGRPTCFQTGHARARRSVVIKRHVPSVHGNAARRSVPCPSMQSSPSTALGGSAHFILIDVHGEATSEKQSMGHYWRRPRPSAVLGHAQP